MQITIHGNERRIRFTKTERAKLAATAKLLAELPSRDDDAAPACHHLGNIVDRISQDGVYSEPETLP